MFGESFAEAWAARYGAPPTADFPELGPFLRHRSVRAFSDRPVSEELISALVGAAQSASTSSNLQLYSMVSVQDRALRAKLNEFTSNQSQVTTAPWFFAFCADHSRLRLAASGSEADNLDYEDYFLMAVVDAALAAERMTVTAEAMGLGVCYIGALRNNPAAVADLLGFPDGVFGVFGLCLGYPAEQCDAAIKPRLHQDAIWFRERYDAKIGVEEYNARMAKFYKSQSQDPTVTWSQRSLRRLEKKYMSGREVIKAWLEKTGFVRR